MSSWKKMLWRMAADTNPQSYSYDDAARILRQLGFEEPSKPDGSHRRWRLKLDNGAVAYVGLLQKGHGSLKAWYIKDMVSTLVEHGLIPVRPTAEDSENGVDNRSKT